jgi:hypothetical protein
MEQSRKDFIKRLFDYAPPIWKVQIEKEFPKLFKEDALVVGDWVCTSQGSIFRIEKIEGNRIIGYGVGYREKTWDTEYYAGKSYCRLATDKEVEQALIKEAKRRGFNFEVNFKFIESGVNHSHLRKVAKVGCTFKYEDGRLQTLGYGDWTIYNNGKWATIIETITKEQAEKAKEILAQYNKQ